MIQRIFRYIYFGISWGCTFFVIINLIVFLTAGEDSIKPIMDDFATQAIGAILVGICCATSSIVYTFEKMSMWKCVCIHFSIGLTGYFIGAYKLGWMPVERAIDTIAFLLIGVIIFVLIWYCFYLYSKYEVKKLNERLKELEEER